MLRSLVLRTAVSVLSFVVVAAVAAAAARADETADRSFQDRLEDLEHRQDAFFAQQASDHGKVATFLQDKLLLGGFFEGALTGISGPATHTQIAGTPDTLAVNLAAEFNESLRFNSQLQVALSYPLQNPNSSPADAPPVTRQLGPLETSPSLPQVYLEYSSEPSLSLQLGRGYVPFGIAFQQRDPVLFRRRGGPQMINANTSNSIVIAAASWDGLHLGGAYRLGAGRWGYDAYSTTPASNPSTLGAGGRLWFELSRNASFGVSSQVGKRGSASFQATGADARLRFGAAGIEAEWAVNMTGAGVGASHSFYAEPYYELVPGTLLVYLAADYFDAPTAEAPDDVPDPYTKWEFGGGVNWLPYPFTRFRLGLLYHDYVGPSPGPERDYASLDLSGGVEF